MKLICDACSAKYSIADEKVAGKVFKIRCKKCSNVIVVRGSHEGGAAPDQIEQKETRVFDYSGDDQCSPTVFPDSVPRPRVIFPRHAVLVLARLASVRGVREFGRKPDRSSGNSDSGCLI